MITLLLLVLALLTVFGLSVTLLYLSIKYIGKVEVTVGSVVLMGFFIWLIASLGAGWLLSIPIGLYLVHRVYKLSWKRSGKVYLVYAIPAGILQIVGILFVHNFVGQAYHMVGTSMSPTLNDADYMLVSRNEYAFGGSDYVPDHGSILVFRFPKDTSRVFAKRVIGVPGDRVVVRNGSVTVYNAEHKDGFNPDTSYEPKGTSTLIDTDEVVQPGNVFVMGDNRSPLGSYDSREWGELPMNYVIGTVRYRLLPLDSAKGF
jgi:signal peptidase I